MRITAWFARVSASTQEQGSENTDKLLTQSSSQGHESQGYQWTVWPGVRPNPPSRPDSGGTHRTLHPLSGNPWDREFSGIPSPQQNLAVWEEWGAQGWGPCLAAEPEAASKPWSGWSHWKESPLTKGVCFWSDTNARTYKSMECKIHYKTLVSKGTPLGTLFVATINVLKSCHAPLIKSLGRVLFNFFHYNLLFASFLKWFQVVKGEHKYIRYIKGFVSNREGKPVRKRIKMYQMHVKNLTNTF